MKFTYKHTSARTATRTIRAATSLLLIVFVAGVTATAARAADAVWIAHRALAIKIGREAGDRYAIRFFSAHVDRLPDGERVVTGAGRFLRRGKSPQLFTYHTTVNVRDNSDRNTGYDIH